MKIFQTVQRNLIPLGYVRDHAEYYKLRRPHLVAIATCVFTGGAISIFIFVIHLADSPAEYMDSLYMSAVLLSIFVSYLTTIWNMTKLFGFIDNLQKFCNESKFYFY